MIGTPYRCVQGAPITVTFASVDSDGEPSEVDPGVVTVTITRANGEAVVTNAATAGTGATRTYLIGADVTETLDELHVTWSTTTATIGRDVVNIVGRPFVSLADLRGTEDSLGVLEDYDAADLIRARNEVESMFDRACGGALSFVPKFAVASVYCDADYWLRLPHYFVRSVRWVKYGASSGTPVDFTSYDLATTVLPEESGMVSITGGAWPVGRLLVGYEHGMNAPPEDVARAAKQAIRRQANLARSGVDSRAMSYTSPMGEVQRFPTPGLGPWTTGVPEVDEVLADYRRRYPPSLVH